MARVVTIPIGPIFTSGPCRGIIHVIEKGDTLYQLGQRYHVSVSRIMFANPYVNIYNLQIGDELCIPVSPQPRVSEAETEAETNFGAENGQMQMEEHSNQDQEQRPGAGRETEENAMPDMPGTLREPGMMMTREMPREQEMAITREMPREQEMDERSQGRLMRGMNELSQEQLMQEEEDFYKSRIKPRETERYESRPMMREEAYAQQSGIEEETQYPAHFLPK